MRTLGRLLLATLTASAVPGPVVLLALMLFPDPSRVVGGLLFAPIFVPAAISFGAFFSVLPAAGLGLTSFAAARLWEPARRRMFWLASGALCGALLTPLLGEQFTIGTDMRVTAVAALAGAASMLTFRAIAQPQHLDPALIVTGPRITALTGTALLASACGIIFIAKPAVDERVAIPDNARFFASNHFRPRTMTLYEYPRGMLPLYRTNGRSITLLTRQPHADSDNAIVDRINLNLGAGEIRGVGDEPAAFTPPRDAPGGAVASAMVEVADTFSARVLRNESAALQQQHLDPSDKRRADPACDLIWLLHRSEYRPAEGANLQPSTDPVQITCALKDACYTRFFYRGAIASTFLQRNALCDWRRHRATIRHALDARLVATTG